MELESESELKLELELDIEVLPPIDRLWTQLKLFQSMGLTIEYQRQIYEKWMKKMTSNDLMNNLSLFIRYGAIVQDMQLRKEISIGCRKNNCKYITKLLYLYWEYPVIDYLIQIECIFITDICTAVNNSTESYNLSDVVRYLNSLHLKFDIPKYLKWGQLPKVSIQPDDVVIVDAVADDAITTGIDHLSIQPDDVVVADAVADDAVADDAITTGIDHLSIQPDDVLPDDCNDWDCCQ